MQNKEAPRKRGPIKYIVNLFVTLSILALLAGGSLFYWGKSEFEKNGPLKGEVTVLIPSGANLGQISNILVDKGVIEYAWLFEIVVRILDEQVNLKAGEYSFSKFDSMHSVLTDILTGKTILHAITFPEGWTSLQIINKLKADPILIGNLTEIPIEGKLMPETYTFSRGTTRKEIVDRMHLEHSEALEEVWKNRSSDLPINSPQELLILASLVEKETGQTDERDRVAGVFVNRLKRGMPLQSDPTILYGLYGGEAWTKSRSIKKSELKKENSYNTYQIPALPPGPIANVGREALEAVANPMKTKELYFVADGTGGHAFSETYEEHRRNVAKWRKIEQQNQ